MSLPAFETWEPSPKPHTPHFTARTLSLPFFRPVSGPMMDVKDVDRFRSHLIHNDERQTRNHKLSRPWHSARPALGFATTQESLRRQTASWQRSRPQWNCPSKWNL